MNDTYTFWEHLLIVSFVGFFGYLWYDRKNPVSSANNTLAYQYTLTGGGMPTFDYASQSNYAMEALTQGSTH